MRTTALQGLPLASLSLRGHAAGGKDGKSLGQATEDRQAVRGKVAAQRSGGSLLLSYDVSVSILSAPPQKPQGVDIKVMVFRDIVAHKRPQQPGDIP